MLPSSRGYVYLVGIGQVGVFSSVQEVEDSFADVQKALAVWIVINVFLYLGMFICLELCFGRIFYFYNDRISFGRSSSFFDDAECVSSMIRKTDCCFFSFVVGKINIFRNLNIFTVRV